jgi:hypothetical protein
MINSESGWLFRLDDILDGRYRLFSAMQADGYPLSFPDQCDEAVFHLT